MSEAKREVPIRLVAVDPPPDAANGVRFGLQEKNGTVDAVPATGTTTFDTMIELVPAGGSAQDFRGLHVHGRRGDRFIYLSWGIDDPAGSYVMVARAKIMLADLPPDLLAAAAAGEVGLECRLAATNAKGQPASGTIRPPGLEWSPSSFDRPSPD